MPFMCPLSGAECVNEKCIGANCAGRPEVKEGRKKSLYRVSWAYIAMLCRAGYFDAKACAEAWFLDELNTLMVVNDGEREITLLNPQSENCRLVRLCNSLEPVGKSEPEKIVEEKQLIDDLVAMRKDALAFDNSPPREPEIKSGCVDAVAFKPGAEINISNEPIYFLSKTGIGVIDEKTACVHDFIYAHSGAKHEFCRFCGLRR